MWRFSILLLAACEQQTYSLDDRPCDSAGQCVAGTIFNGVGEPEEVTFTVNAGQTVYVVVDGELASRGDFELDVSF